MDEPASRCAALKLFGAGLGVVAALGHRLAEVPRRRDFRTTQAVPGDPSEWDGNFPPPSS